MHNVINIKAVLSEAIELSDEIKSKWNDSIAIKSGRGKY